jgi:hypothetical protein
MANEGAKGGGIGFAGLLTVAFIVLKLTGTIAWSWWWVLSPLWIPIVILICVFLFFIVMKAIFD